MNSSAIISKLEAEGWREVRVRGSHHYFKRLGSKMTVCVPHPKKDLPIGTGVSGFLCLGRLFQGQPNEAALCFL